MKSHTGTIKHFKIKPLTICRSLLLPLGTHHSDPVSNGLGGQVAAKLGSDHPTAAVSPGHFSPDDPGLIGFTAWSHCVPEGARGALAYYKRIAQTGGDSLKST